VSKDFGFTLVRILILKSRGSSSSATRNNIWSDGEKWNSKR
jgi:hypothetical protein